MRVGALTLALWDGNPQSTQACLLRAMATLTCIQILLGGRHLPYTILHRTCAVLTVPSQISTSSNHGLSAAKSGPDKFFKVDSVRAIFLEDLNRLSYTQVEANYVQLWGFVLPSIIEDTQYTNTY